MSDAHTDPDSTATDPEQHPGATSIVTLPTVQVTPAAERETLSIMRSRAKFAASGEVRAM